MHIKVYLMPAIEKGVAKIINQLQNIKSLETWTHEQLVLLGRNAAAWRLFATSAKQDVFLFQNKPQGLQVSVYQHANGDYELGRIWAV
ncbi:hypothetical protein LAC03_24690 [Levilactobacillus acidifarinae]|nr:hypothetical protein LAC03_24690 [Levilactobacillus acidifarinae]